MRKKKIKRRKYKKYYIKLRKKYIQKGKGFGDGFKLLYSISKQWRNSAR